MQGEQLNYNLVSEKRKNSSAFPLSLGLGLSKLTYFEASCLKLLKEFVHSILWKRRFARKDQFCVRVCLSLSKLTYCEAFCLKLLKEFVHSILWKRRFARKDQFCVRVCLGLSELAIFEKLLKLLKDLCISRKIRIVISHEFCVCLGFRE